MIVVSFQDARKVAADTTLMQVQFLIFSNTHNIQTVNLIQTFLTYASLK